jgi:hypothetical protein
MSRENINEKEYTFTPLIFCGRRYQVTWWQSAVIALVTALLLFSNFLIKNNYIKFCHDLCAGYDFAFFWVFWAVESTKNYILLFLLKVDRS